MDLYGVPLEHLIPGSEIIAAVRTHFNSLFSAILPTTLIRGSLGFSNESVVARDAVWKGLRNIFLHEKGALADMIDALNEMGVREDNCLTPQDCRLVMQSLEAAFLAKVAVLDGGVNFITTDVDLVRQFSDILGVPDHAGYIRDDNGEIDMYSVGFSYFSPALDEVVRKVAFLVREQFNTLMS